MSTVLPFVSIVVPAFNAAATIVGLIESIRLQQYPRERLELLIIDDGSNDATAKLVLSEIERLPVGEHPEIRFFTQANQGPSAARNRGIHEAKGDLVGFTDADCIAAPDWISNLARHFTDPMIIGAGGRQDCPPDASPFMREVHATLGMTGFLGGYIKAGERVQTTGHNPSCSSMYRRHQILQAGGFREGLFPGEDVDLDRRMATMFPATRILYDPAAVVYHYRPDSYRRWAWMMWRYGCSNAWNVRLHGYFRLSQRVPWVVLMATVLAMILLLKALSRSSPRKILVGAGMAGLGLWVVDKVTGKQVSSRLVLFLIMIAAFPAGFFHALYVDRLTFPEGRS